MGKAFILRDLASVQRRPTRRSLESFDSANVNADLARDAVEKQLVDWVGAHRELQ
jgi:hypothetical protein